METCNPATTKKQNSHPGPISIDAQPSLPFLITLFHSIYSSNRPPPHLHWCVMHLPPSTSISFSSNTPSPAKVLLNQIGCCCTPQILPTLTPPLLKAAPYCVAHLHSDSWPVKIRPSTAPQTSGNSPRTPCKTLRTKNQLKPCHISSHTPTTQGTQIPTITDSYIYIICDI